MRPIALAAAMLAIAIPAHAQSDKLCGTLDGLITAAAEPTPFLTLAPPGDKIPSFARLDHPKPAGLEQSSECTVYFAGSAEKGVIGGGKYNRAGCTLARSSERQEADAGLRLKAMAEAMAARVGSCLKSKGWTAERMSVENQGRSNTWTWRFFRPKSDIDVAVIVESFVIGRTPASMDTTWTADAYVRSPNPKDPSWAKPQ